ncbi:MAG: transposase, partial [Euryarchaeota archaeon]|nr:transposase [Euryarchaeota archaeon]
MIRSARDNGVPFGWVGVDSFYGEQPWLRNEIAAEGLIYIADIPVNTRVWLNKPETGIPERKGNRGRIPTKEKMLEGEPDPIEVRDLNDQLEALEWSHVFIRDTERKKLWSNIACIRVYPVVDGLPGDEIWLIIRQDDGEESVKYQFSNAPPDTSVERFSQMSCSRYWIERAFEDG